MHQHHKKTGTTDKNTPRIALVGNPNVGKSSIFSLLTGRYVTVSNYPGTTVEIVTGNTAIGKKRFLIIDSPGVNSLMPMSEDEKVTRDILLEEETASVIQVADTKNIKRSLFLTLQLVEMGLPVVLDLNMRDESLSRGIKIEEDVLGDILGIEIVSTIAVQKKGIDSLKKAVLRSNVSSYSFSYDMNIEEHISRIESLLPEAHISKRSIALMILSGDKTLKDWLHKKVKGKDLDRIEELRDRLSEKYAHPLNYVISQQRFKIVDDIAQRVFTKIPVRRSGASALLDKITTHPVLGFPFLFLVLFVLYEFVGVFGAGTLVDLIEDVVFEKYLNPLATNIITAVLPVKFIQDLLVGPYGIITMAITYAIAIILPITATFFIAFAVMEDSGYLPRLATMLNRVFRAIGLNGKAVLPMVLGLGCDTMATLTARIMDTRKERIIVTLLLALGVPCSAQLGVILGMFGKQPIEALLIWIAVLTGVMLFVGYISSKIVPGQDSDFILEIPPLRLPQLSNILIKTMGRIEWYLKEAVPLFILGTLVLFTADKLKLLPLIEKAASPVIVNFLGLPAKAAESFIIGFLRRDYGAAGLFALQEQGMLNTEQVVVSLTTITLFIPCIANLFVIIKERGLKTALIITAFVFPFSIMVGGLLHHLLSWLRVFN
ncbi:ferrous iron transport protein B [bacterium BMS3Abin10]|nr:ferrous iron transport protein B [bacterium BMS3Abin10]GBE37635.1 ferrous iron transport protein B [bacterium BMS3Bbin08]